MILETECRNSPSFFFPFEDAMKTQKNRISVEWDNFAGAIKVQMKDQTYFGNEYFPAETTAAQEFAETKKMTKYLSKGSQDDRMDGYLTALFFGQLLHSKFTKEEASTKASFYWGLKDKHKHMWWTIARLLYTNIGEKVSF